MARRVKITETDKLRMQAEQAIAKATGGYKRLCYVCGRRAAGPGADVPAETRVCDECYAWLLVPGKEGYEIKKRFNEVQREFIRFLFDKAQALTLPGPDVYRAIIARYS